MMSIDIIGDVWYVDIVGCVVLEIICGYGVIVIFGIFGMYNLEFYWFFVDFGICVVMNWYEQGFGYGVDGWFQQIGFFGVVIIMFGLGLQNVMSVIGIVFCEL